jgi:hypothetical protein
VKRLAKVTTQDLTTALMKSETVIFRCTAPEKAQMKAQATALGMSLSEYLTRLHALAHAKLSRPK